MARSAKGFTGADCALCVKEAAREAILRHTHNDNGNYNDGNGVGTSDDPPPVQITLTDLHNAVRHTRPSAIRSATVEIPRVPWSSIGGIHSVPLHVWQRFCFL